MRHVMIGLAAVGSLAMVAVAQPRKPDATLSLSEGSVVAGVGFQLGQRGPRAGKGKPLRHVPRAHRRAADVSQPHGQIPASHRIGPTAVGIIVGLVLQLLALVHDLLPGWAQAG